MTIGRRAKRITTLLAAGWCLSTLASPMVKAQVMDQVPGDSLVVLKINHLSDASTKISTLLQTLGVTDVLPMMKDPLQALEDQLSITAGLDPKRDAAIFMPNLPMGDTNTPPIVILLPVSDYKAFLSSTTVIHTDGDVSVVHFKDKDEDAFIQSWGSYAAISSKKDYITGKHEGIKTTGPSAKQLDEKDLCIYVNFPALKTPMLAKLKENTDHSTEEIAKGTDPAKVKARQASLKTIVNVMTEFLTDAQAATIGISVTADGISSSTIVELPPESYLGKATAQLKMTDQPLLTGLPKENYLFFEGVTGNGKQFAQIFDDVLAPLLTELPGVGDDGKKLAGALDTIKAAVASFDSGAFGIIAPTAAVGQGPMFRLLGVFKADAEALKAADIKAIEAINASDKIFDDYPTDLLKPTVTADFKTINAVKFERLQAEVNPDDTSQAAMHLGEGMNQFFGPDGASALLGTVNPKTLVVSVGNDDDLLGQTVDAAKAGKDVMTEDLAEVDAGLPKQRALAAYIGLGQFMNTALSYAKANGMNMPVQIPKNLPPIGYTYGSEGPDMRIDTFVPIKLLQTLVQAGLQVYMQVNGHGGGGGL